MTNILQFRQKFKAEDLAAKQAEELRKYKARLGFMIMTVLLCGGVYAYGLWVFIGMFW